MSFHLKKKKKKAHFGGDGGKINYNNINNQCHVSFSSHSNNITFTMASFKAVVFWI